jgi:hypothetical protein
LTTLDPSLKCPACGSPDRVKRYGSKLLINSVPPPPIIQCQSAWHDPDAQLVAQVQDNAQPREFSDPTHHRFLTAPEDPVLIHRPQLARTMMEGPGNRTRIRGCSCGATPMSPEAFAEHVGLTVDAVQAMLNLAGLAYDLLDHHDHPRMARESVMQQIARCLEFRR